MFQDRSIVRNYGYSVRGHAALGNVASNRAQRITSIAAISYNGLLACKLTKKTLNGRRFKNFLRKEIVPLLQPYNGVNSQSVVVMGEYRTVLYTFLPFNTAFSRTLIG